MTGQNTLTRFLDAQNQMYLKALGEIKNGKKESHWMWFVFPQIKGLGLSKTSKYYGINDIEEAEAYLAHPVLGRHLIEISQELLKIEDKTANEIFGSPDDMKLRSSMTLFASIPNTQPVFKKVLEKFYSGLPDVQSVEILEKHGFPVKF